MDELKLMQDYFWILEKCQDPQIVFKDRPAEREFACLWLSKLCNDIYRGSDAKRIRNLYLMELSKGIDHAELNKVFMQIPPNGPLEPIEGASHIKIDDETIVHEMQSAAPEFVPPSLAKNYQSHMSTKIFDNNRGACAYLAVSLGDPKQGPIWMQMGSKKPYQPKPKTAANACQQQQQQCPKPQQQCPKQQGGCGGGGGGGGGGGNANLNVGFGEFCLEAIAKELAGQAAPCDCPELEAQLEKYSAFIRNYPVGEEAKNLEGSNLRTFLLLNLQTDLVQALKECQ